MLSGELATYLAGRSIEIPVLPLAFPEFCAFQELPKTEETLLQYLKYGGLPYLINLELRDEIVYDYLKNIYTGILFRDIVTRHKIRQIAFLESLVEFLADNLGCEFSAQRISNFLKAQNRKISSNVILNYLNFLEQAFFLARVPRQDLIGKKIFTINAKYYFTDLGLRNSLVAYKQPDLGKLLENLVYQHLCFSGYTVRVGKLDKLEIDFVCQKPGESKKKYVQVAYLIPDAQVARREFGNLLKIQDNYPKIVVSLDRLINHDYQGIQHVNVLDFVSEVQ